MDVSLNEKIVVDIVYFYTCEWTLWNIVVEKKHGYLLLCDLLLGENTEDKQWTFYMGIEH